MPLLYFSLLPVDLNRYFYNKYLALECNVIWHQIYGWEDIRSPYLDAFHHYLAKSGYSGLYRDAKHFSNRCIQRGSISMIQLQGPNSYWYSDWYRYQIQRPDGLVTWLQRQGYKAHIPPDSRLNGTKILRCVFTSIEEIDKWENLHHADSLEPIKPIMLDWIRTRSPDREALIQYAAKNAYINLIHDMETKHCLSKDYVGVANWAAKSGHITTLCWLKENHYAINGYTSIYAARKGHLETVKWLYENTTTVYCADEDDDCEDDTHAPQIAFAAVESGNLELLQYLYGKAPIDYGYVRCAAIERGYLDILRWIPKENGYSTMADAAAEYGHFEVLKWLNETGDHVNEDAFWKAVQSGHHELLEWIVENITEPHKRPDLRKRKAIESLYVYDVDPKIIERLRRNYPM
jgi:hypothetical protein